MAILVVKDFVATGKGFESLTLLATYNDFVFSSIHLILIDVGPTMIEWIGPTMIGDFLHVNVEVDSHSEAKDRNARSLYVSFPPVQEPLLNL